MNKRIVGENQEAMGSSGGNVAIDLRIEMTVPWRMTLAQSSCLGLGLKGDPDKVIVRGLQVG